MIIGLGEKELFHEQSVRVPMIIYDPSDYANKTRGTKEQRFIEAIDLLPTFLDAVESPASKHRLEGNSLIPLLKGESTKGWKEFVFSEIEKYVNNGTSDFS